MKISSLSVVVGSLTFLAGCAGPNNINVVQDFEGEHVLATAEFGEENLGFVSSVAMADSTVSTRIDLERQPSSVVITQSRNGEEVVSWSGVQTFAWQHKPLGRGRTMRLTITVTTPDEHLLSSFVPTSTTETWLAVLVDDHLVDLDEFLDGCASDGDRTERPATRRRPASDDEGDAEDEEPTARRPSRRNSEEEPRRAGPGGLGVRRRRRPEPEVPTTRRDLRQEEVEEESLAAAPTVLLLE